MGKNVVSKSSSTHGWVGVASVAFVAVRKNAKTSEL